MNEKRNIMQSYTDKAIKTIIYYVCVCVFVYKIMCNIHK